MAQQLIQDRTPAAYTGVESYARAHSKEDAGALAWLVVGYAHVIDRDFAKAIDPLNRAKPLAGDLGDYVAYYLGTWYLQTGAGPKSGGARQFLCYVSGLAFDSRLHLSYANALLDEGRASEVTELLEKDRLPARSDIELALGKAYATLKQNAKASEAFSNIYFNMPLSAEAEPAYEELKKLPIASQSTPAQRKTRAELLMKGTRYADAIDEYRDIASHATPDSRISAELAFAEALHRGGRNREAKSEVTNLSGGTPEQSAQRLYILAEVAGPRARTTLSIARSTNASRRLRVLGLSRPSYWSRIFTSCTMSPIRHWTLSANHSSVSRTEHAPRTRTGRLLG